MVVLGVFKQNKEQKHKITKHNSIDTGALEMYNKSIKVKVGGKFTLLNF